MRESRRRLTPLQQRKAEQALARTICQTGEFKRAKRLAFYLPNDGEISPVSLIQLAQSMGKQCYLPVLHPVYENSLWFVRYDDDQSLALNKFGIPEPRGTGKPVAPQTLDIVFMPLVAFDRSGHRLGMGGGYYDRTLAFKRSKPGIKPLLIGLAHTFQEVSVLPAEEWDIPLNAIAMDSNFHRT